MRQTTIQVPAAIRKGSVRVLVGDDFNSLVDIGVLRNPAVNFLAETQRVEFDNAAGLEYFVKGDRIQVTFDLAEINLDTIAVLDAGLVTVTPVAGSIVNNHQQLVVAGDWAYNQFIPFDHQNYDGTEPNVDSVTAATNGVLVSETDYFIGRDSNNVWGIYIKDSATVTTLNQNITVQFDYTPAASNVMTTTASGKKTLKCMRIINEDNDGKLFQLDIENGTNRAPIKIGFAGDEKDDVAIQPVDFQGVFVSYTDEQNA